MDNQFETIENSAAIAHIALEKALAAKFFGLNVEALSDEQQGEWVDKNGEKLARIMSDDPSMLAEFVRDERGTVDKVDAILNGERQG